MVSDSKQFETGSTYQKRSEKEVGGLLPLHRPRLVELKTQSLRLVLEHQRERYDQLRAALN
jgi:hypothetical protein